ncbi:MAG: carboxymuconolactone decarboxylase family protein [Anaerolineales bacterium]|jgi:AhpD family alkylhydroperoxidase
MLTQTNFKERLDYQKAAPGGVRALLEMEHYLATCGLEQDLMDLVKLRASQINGCAYCIDMHSKDLRAQGESEQRLYELDAWQETPFYTERERAALLWAEAVTRVADTHVPDAVYEQVRQQFTESELVNLTFIIATINVWNRILISSRREPGSYRPAR